MLAASVKAWDAAALLVWGWQMRWYLGKVNLSHDLCWAVLSFRLNRLGRGWFYVWDWDLNTFLSTDVSQVNLPVPPLPRFSTRLKYLPPSLASVLPFSFKRHLNPAVLSMCVFTECTYMPWLCSEPCSWLKVCTPKIGVHTNQNHLF